MSSSPADSVTTTLLNSTLRIPFADDDNPIDRDDDNDPVFVVGRGIGSAFSPNDDFSQSADLGASARR